MNHSSPQARYDADLSDADFVADPAQAAAVACLESIHQALLSAAEPTGMLAKLFGKNTITSVQGAYFWGGVGRGKTYLMDCFYETLPFPQKRRVHFHRFMQEVHQRTKALGQISDPLTHIAKELAAEVRVLCFDEFFVSDVADAMILARLLDKLFGHGLCLVATSNIPPDQLYRNGLQRERFLPAIAGLQKHCHIVNVDGGTDYRLRLLEKAAIYHTPLSADTDAQLADAFARISPDAAHPETSVDINGRAISVRAHADGVAWFSYDALCRGPRAAVDYIEIARLYGTVLLSDVPQMNWEMENEARRFLHLIDEFYDRKVKLIISAQVPMEALYIGQKLNFEYARVVSRLQEMQSHDYLAAPHLP